MTVLRPAVYLFRALLLPLAGPPGPAPAPVHVAQIVALVDLEDRLPHELNDVLGVLPQHELPEARLGPGLRKCAGFGR